MGVIADWSTDLVAARRHAFERLRLAVSKNGITVEVHGRWEPDWTPDLHPEDADGCWVFDVSDLPADARVVAWMPIPEVRLGEGAMTDSDILSSASVPLRVADLLQAAELTGGDRNASYGDPVENYRHTVAVFNAITGRDLTAREGALFMVAVKLARLRAAPRHTDSHVDAMAYLGIVHECAEAEAAS